jgi:hypothetical protein
MAYKGHGDLEFAPDGSALRVKKSGLERLNSGMMNPFSWSREHQLALLVAALIAAALAAVLGYIVYAVGWGEGAVPFESWILRLLRGPIWWALFGAVIGGASMFVCILIRAPFEDAQLRTPIVQSSILTEHSPHYRLAQPLKERPPSPRA